METQKTLNSLRKKNGAGGINLPDFRLYYKVTLIKKVWHLHKNSNTDQRSETESQRETHAPVGASSLTKEVQIYNRNTILKASAISGSEKTGHAKEETRTPPNTIQK